VKWVNPFHFWLKKNSGCHGEDPVAPAILFEVIYLLSFEYNYCATSRTLFATSADVLPVPGTIFGTLTFNFFDKSAIAIFQQNLLH